MSSGDNVNCLINVMHQYFYILLLCLARYRAKKLNLMDLIGLLLTNLYLLCLHSSLPPAMYKANHLITYSNITQGRKDG